MPRSAVFFLAGCMCLASCAKKQAASTARVVPDSLKRYPFRSAIIELRYGGSARGTQMIYIDDFGLKETKVDSFTTNVMDMDMPTHKLEIRSDDSLFSVDFVRGIGSRGRSEITARDQKEMKAAGEEMAKGMGFKKGEDVVAGQKCVVWSSEDLGSKAWMWNDITLKSEAAIGDMKVLLEAVRVDLDVPVPGERFAAPSGINLITTEDVVKKLDEMKGMFDEDTKKKGR